jgi:epoxyqueuosine reductase
MNAAELEQLAYELGIDVVGATPAEPYDETERHIRDRHARGLFADMRFTMAQPDVSCHPELLLPNARTVVSAALCYYAEEPERPPGHGRLPRYTWYDAYAELREKLDQLGRRLQDAAAGKAAGGSNRRRNRSPEGGEYRVLVDENQHVDREAAARSGVGFYGKNTLLITRRFGSWVVLGTLVTELELEPTQPLGLDCGSCTLCIEACPTGALDEPGTLDATKCLSYWTQSAHDPPEAYREALEAQVYGCDICQDVCPWNRGIEKRRQGNPPPAEAEPHVDLVDWLESDPDELRERYARLYVPRNDGRFLQRNARIALANQEAAAR